MCVGESVQKHLNGDQQTTIRGILQEPSTSFFEIGSLSVNSPRRLAQLISEPSYRLVSSSPALRSQPQLCNGDYTVYGDLLQVLLSAGKALN